MTTDILIGLFRNAISFATPRLFGGQTKFIALHDALLSESQKVDEHFRVLREADMDVAVNAFRRGIDVRRQFKDKVSGAWRDDIEFALERAQIGYFEVSKTEQKIKCYEIMCLCFLALREPDEAFASILKSTETLLENEYVNDSLDNLKKTIQKPRKTLSTEDNDLLSLLFNGVCGIIEVCSQDKDWNRDKFRKLFKNHEHLPQATDPELFQEWERLQVSSGWNGSFIWKPKRLSDIIKFHEILVDLTHSDSPDAYRLGEIIVVESDEQYKVVPDTRSNPQYLMPELTTIEVIAPLLLMAFLLLLVFLTYICHMSSPSQATPSLLIKDRIIHFLPQIEDPDFWALE